LSGCRVVTLDSRRLRQIRREVSKLINLGTGNASLPATHANTARILQQFAESAIFETQPSESIGRGRPRLNRYEVIRLVKDDLASKSKQASIVGELADAAEVSERTLLRAFQDWYGISPVRYARLRQIHAVRDALLAADPRSTTVTAVLTQHDVDQFGRFAGLYHSLFGESPSETLSRDKR
jgi:AraC family ethanolamine operon transcriptional activator